jgi:DNA-binding transcriptional regulator YiaG
MYLALLFPPPPDSFHRKLGGVCALPYINLPPVANYLINTVWYRFSHGVLTKIVDIYILLKRETEMRKSAKSAADSGEVSFALLPLKREIGEMENAKVRSEEVRKLRESMGWKEIADRYGVSTRTVQNWARE